MKVEIESNRMVANRKWQCERITFDVSESFATKWNAVRYGNCTLDTCSIFQWPRTVRFIANCNWSSEWVCERASGRAKELSKVCTHYTIAGSDIAMSNVCILNVDIIGIDVICHPSHSTSIRITRFHFFISSQCFSFSSRKKRSDEKNCTCSYIIILAVCHFQFHFVMFVFAFEIYTWRWLDLFVFSPFWLSIVVSALANPTVSRKEIILCVQWNFVFTLHKMHTHFPIEEIKWRSVCDYQRYSFTHIYIRCENADFYCRTNASANA